MIQIFEDPVSSEEAQLSDHILYLYHHALGEEGDDGGGGDGGGGLSMASSLLVSPRRVLLKLASPGNSCPFKFMEEQ